MFVIRWNYIQRVVHKAIRCLSDSKTNQLNLLSTNATGDTNINVFLDDWHPFCRKIDEYVAADEFFRPHRLFYYVAKHGLKNSSLTYVRDMVFDAADLSCPKISLIQLHLAAVLSLADHAVLLRQDRVSSIVLGSPSYFRPFLMNRFCHISGGTGLRNGPAAVSYVQAYDGASHMFKMNVIGSNAIVAVLG